MAKAFPTKIVIQVNSESGTRPIHDDMVGATATIQPGMLLEVDANEALIRHNSANAISVPRRVAVKNPYGDDLTVSAIADTYAIGETVRYIFPQSGDLLYMLIEASAVLVKGQTYLASAGDGTLQAITPDATTVDGAVVGQAEQDITIGGSAGFAHVRMV